jgi:hypothetical protein
MMMRTQSTQEETMRHTDPLWNDAEARSEHVVDDWMHVPTLKKVSTPEEYERRARAIEDLLSDYK